MGRWILAFGALCAAASSGFSADESVEERVRRLEEQNRAILERLQRSESRNAALEEEARRFQEERRQILATEVEGYLQATEGADTEERSFWKKLTRSGNVLQIYGFVRMDAYYNSARADHAIIPIVVLPEDGTVAKRDDDQFAFDVRLTRIGFNFDFGEIGPARVTAKIETDFANFPSGTSESRQTPRIRLAFINIERGRWTFRFGQDWDVIAPLFPAANNETLMWNAGNLGDRRPMAQAIYKTKSEEGTEWTIRIALGMSGAVDNRDLDPVVAGVSSERDGFDSGHPHLQVRAGVSGTSWVEEKRWEAGVWGYVAGLETDTLFAGNDEFTPFVVGLDFQVPLCRRFSVRGELWIGQALSDMRGNVGQTINTTTGDEIAGWGGWMELVFVANAQWRFHLGGTIDDPEDGDVAAGGRTRNWTTYVGTVRDFTNGLRAGCDVIYWETSTVGMGLGNMIRVNVWIQIDF
ncbi:MAG: hypothetical protein ACT4PV_08480 [Planctomycetaceae bacterium]